MNSTTLLSLAATALYENPGPEGECFRRDTNRALQTVVDNTGWTQEVVAADGCTFEVLYPREVFQ